MKNLIFRYWDDVLKYFVRSDEFQMENELESLSEFFKKASIYAGWEPNTKQSIKLNK
jgi:hypothetical protein